jgi:LacI family fructose operon transcriptional repressor
MFVNSTISLEGVMRWIKRSGHYKDRTPVIGCFDWDPFAALLGDEIEMVRQDVQGMLDAVFNIIDEGAATGSLVEIPPIFMGAEIPGSPVSNSI